MAAKMKAVLRRMKLSHLLSPHLNRRPAVARPAGAGLFVLCVLFLALSLGCSAAPESTPVPAGAVTPNSPATLLASPAAPTPILTPTATLFRLATPSSAPSPTAAVRPATATPACQDGLRFLADITVPDGTIVSPGEAIDKQWQVENSGTCNWNERYRLRRISGPPLDAPDEQALYPARSGTQAVISVLLVAPPDPGTYRSAWQAYSPQGDPFGDPIYVEILVSSASP
jgi:hypothetical protein